MQTRSKATASFKPAAYLGTLCATALIAAAIALLSQSSHAQTQQPTQPPAPPPPPVQAGQLAPPPPGSANFAQHQQKELDHIAAKIQILQSLQSCVQSAIDRGAIKSCNEMAKQSEQQLHH